MIKKIQVSQLRPGMWVADFNAGWLEHPFLHNSMRIDADEQIEKISAAGIRELFIDTVRGADVGDAPTREEAQATTEREIAAVMTAAPPPVEEERQAPLREEIERAQTAFSEATRIVHHLMDDVRLGRQIEVESLQPTVEKIIGSVIRNANALMTIRRLQQCDDYTFLHSVSVCTMLTTFAKAVGFDAAALRDAALGGLLHDIGKVRVAPAVLNKPAKLTDDEFAHMKSHVTRGVELLQQTPGVSRRALDVAEFHHERYDGTGYPHASKGEAIPQLGRMAAIVDVYDAITSDRVYHRGMSPAAAMQKLFEWSKFHFDPVLVQRFIRSVGIYPVGTLVRLASERLAVVVEQRENSLLQPLVRVVYDSKRGRALATEDFELASGSDRIVGFEAAEKWPIDVPRFMAPA